MLKIYFVDMEEAVYHPPVYFDNQYEDGLQMQIYDQAIAHVAN